MIIKNKIFRNFATAVLKIKEIKSLDKPKVELKDFYFKFQNIQYRSQIPLNIDQSIKDYLNHFGKDRSISTRTSMSHLDFEMARGGRYLPQNVLLNNVQTQLEEHNAILILDDRLTLNNIRFRNLDHLRFPFESSSQTLQTFLNEFIEKVQIDKTKVDTEFIKTLVKTLVNLKDNKSKLIIAIGSLLEKIKLVTDNKVKIEFKTNHTFDLKKFDKKDKDNVLIIENKETNNCIPVNLVLSKNEDEKLRNFDEAIIDNFDSLRKLSLITKNKSNFGIVTDFYNWKFNYYHRSEPGRVEDPLDYLTSLKYNLSVSSEYINEHTYVILLKVLAGIISIDSDKLNSVKL